MKLIDRDPFRIVGQAGERISVAVHSTGTAHLVTYNLNVKAGLLPEGQPLLFPLDLNPTLLLLSLGFSDPQAGGYRIHVTGSGGGDESNYVLKQSPNPASSETLTYRFTLTAEPLRQGGADMSKAMGQPRFGKKVSDLGGDETKDDYE